MHPSVDAMYAEDYPFAEPISISESELSPKLGLIYHLTDSSEVYVQYSRGFRAPPYEDANISLELPLFNIRAVPNPDLRSERSDGFDLGVRWRGTSSNAHLSVFRTEYRDFIESKVRLGPDPDSGRILFQSQNITARSARDCP
jgi:hemoglobin/transferrin/lactoferrin receptor protein